MTHVIGELVGIERPTQEQMFGTLIVRAPTLALYQEFAFSITSESQLKVTIWKNGDVFVRHEGNLTGANLDELDDEQILILNIFLFTLKNWREQGKLAESFTTTDQEFELECACT